MNSINDIILTEAALRHVQHRIETRGSGQGLRIGVKTTGCSGLSYIVDIADQAASDDQVFVQADGTKVFVDSKSFPFIKGLLVDYVRNGLNSGFKFTNPNAIGSCGCGESFSVENK